MGINYQDALDDFDEFKESESFAEYVDRNRDKIKAFLEKQAEEYVEGKFKEYEKKAFDKIISILREKAYGKEKVCKECLAHSLGARASVDVIVITVFNCIGHPADCIM